MNIDKMTRKQFEELPHREWSEEIKCDSIIILPLKEMHDSGYRCMDFVAVKDNEAVCLLSGCSDVIHIDGIAGLGKDWLKKYGSIPRLIPPSEWCIDCLPRSGLLRLWPGSREMSCGSALGSFEIYAEPKPRKK